MFCEKCGAECKDGAKFCSKCGAPLQLDSLTNGESISAADSENNAPSGGWFQQHKKIALTILIVIIAVVVVIIAVSVARHFSKGADMSLEEHLERGIRYLDDDEYEEAAAEFTAALDIEPNMQAYRYLADAYLDLSEEDPTSEVKAKFADKVYKGTAREVYTDLAGDVYEEAVAYALDTYDQTGDLPQNTESLYEDAIVYEADIGDVIGLNELGELIILPNDEGEKTSEDTKETRNVDIADEADNVNDEDETQEGSSSGAVAALSARGEETVDWKELYRDYITNLPENDFLYGYGDYDPEYSFSLIYIDDDEVPELLFQNMGKDDSWDTSSLHYIVDTYYYLLNIENGKVKEHTFFQDAHGSFTYIERSGLCCVYSGFIYETSSSVQENFSQKVYDLRDDYGIKTVFSGTLDCNIFSEGWRYKLNDDGSAEVTEEEYEAELNDVYDTSQAVAPTMVSLEEVLSELDA